MLSIITITKNDPVALRRTLASTQLIRSEWNLIEQLIIDGSNDENAQINFEICNTQVKVVYSRREPRGISDAFNNGIEMANYKWLWFLNGGDQLNSALSLSFFNSILSYVTADILICQVQLEKNSFIQQFPPINKCFPPVVPWIPHPATLINKEIFSKYGRFDEKYKIAMDYELWLRVFEKKVVINMLSVPLTIFDETGISSVEPRKVNHEGKEILRKYKMQLVKIWLKSGRSILKQYSRFKKSVNGN